MFVEAVGWGALAARDDVGGDAAHVHRILLGGQPDALQRRAAGVGAHHVHGYALAAGEIDDLLHRRLGARRPVCAHHDRVHVLSLRAV